MCNPLCATAQRMAELEALDALEKAAMAATPGPWIRWAGHASVHYGKPTTNRRGILRGHKGTICECDDMEAGERGAVRNATFIATANPTMILDLITRLRNAEGLVTKLAELEAENGRLREENEDLKVSVIAFGAVHATQYAQEHGLPRGHLHAVHYDVLAKAGARMDDFTRHEPALAPTEARDAR